MIGIIRNIIQHGGQLKFDPTYIQILIKALNCGIEAYARAYGLIPEDVDKYFIPPECFTNIQETLEQKGIVLITGDPLIGKTTIAKKLEKEFAKRGFEIVRDNWNVEFKDKRLFVFDNCFGEADIDQIRLRKTVEFLEQYLMEKNKDVKVILTSRNDVFEKVKNTEDFKNSEVSEILQQVRVNITVNDYSTSLDKLLEKNLTKNQVKEDIARKVLEYSDKILDELMYPGEIDNFCRLARDLDEIDDEIVQDLIQRSKFIEIWISKKLESLRFDEKALLILLCILGRIEISTMETFLIEFSKEVHKHIDPGSSIEIEDIYLHLASRIKNLSGIIEIQSEEVFDKVWAYLDFTHERIREVVFNFIVSTALEDLRRVLDLLLDLRKDFDEIEQKLTLFIVRQYDILQEYRAIIFQRLDKLSKIHEKSAITELYDTLSEIINRLANRPEIQELLLNISKHERINVMLSKILKDKFDKIDKEFAIRLFRVLLDNSTDKSKKNLVALYFKHYRDLSNVIDAEHMFSWLIEHPETAWNVFKIAEDKGKTFIANKLDPANPQHRKILTAMLLEFGYDIFRRKFTFEL